MSWSEYWNALEHDDESYEDGAKRGGFALSKEGRIEHGWCVACGRFVVEVYFCTECSVHSQYTYFRHLDDVRSPTATLCGRALQLRVERDAAYEQMMQLQTVCDPGVVTVDSPKWANEFARSAKIRSLNARNNAVGNAFAKANVPGPKFEFNRPDWHVRKRGKNAV